MADVICDEVIAILTKGGIDIEEFNKGLKTLDDLCQEIERGEATLKYNEETGRVERHAHSVKIAIESNGYELREVGRIYLHRGENGEPVKIEYPEPKDYAASETVLPHELGKPLLTAARCLEEEWGMSPDDFVVKPVLLGPPVKEPLERSETFKGVLCLDHLYYLHHEHGSADPNEEPEPHESSAYYGILSFVKEARTRLVMPKRRWSEKRTLRDGEVLLLIRWFPLYPELEAIA
ncbi:MAG: hypothetical protein ACM3TU_03775 [Bacillota bacterium]